MEKKYEAVFCVINAGFADAVMYAARKAGAGGGTIIKGRGTAPLEAEKLFKITVEPEKEIVMMLVPEEIKDDVLRELREGKGKQFDPELLELFLDAIENGEIDLESLYSVSSEAGEEGGSGG